MLKLNDEPTPEERAKDQLGHVSPLAWTMNNHIITENEKPIEFARHRFLIKPYNDMHPKQVARKSAQVGWTTLAIIKSFYMAKEYGFNAIYTLPTRTVVKDFVAPKVDKIFDNNPVMKDAVGKDSENLKAIGSRFIYYRGAWSDTEAIMISADLLINDEKDKSDQKVLETYQSRLQASEYGWQWEFSNPSIPGYGVDEDYQNSDQMHWFITCHHCGHSMFIDFTKSGYKNHYVDVEREIYACGSCDKEISDADRQNGYWTPKYPMEKHPEIKIRGYWLSQLIVPYVKATYIIEKSKGDQDFFHNMVLGKAWQPADMKISRSMILKNASPGETSTTHLCLGVDNGRVKHWVLGNEHGVIRFGETEDWADIEAFIKMGAITVIDANPYPRVPKELVEKYPGRVFVNYYNEDSKNLGSIREKQGEDAGVILSDRTRMFDDYVSDLMNNRFLYYLSATELDELIDHADAMYRTVETNKRGRKRGVWITVEGKPDHLTHATVYMRIAQSMIREMTETGIVRPDDQPSILKQYKKGIKVKEDGTMDSGIDLEEIARGNELGKKSWENL